MWLSNYSSTRQGNREDFPNDCRAKITPWGQAWWLLSGNASYLSSEGGVRRISGPRLAPGKSTRPYLKKKVKKLKPEKAGGVIQAVDLPTSMKP
jgi:hypothetical protein